MKTVIIIIAVLYLVGNLSNHVRAGTPPTVEQLHTYLIKIGADFPDIVTAQAVLETGHFESRACVELNNLFGLTRGGDKNGYQVFSSWQECCREYQRQIQWRYYSGGDYYDFLGCMWMHRDGRCVPYAKETEYCERVKTIVAANSGGK